MLQILLIYAHEHPQLKYRQGMHELLAPIIYTLHQNIEQSAYAHARTHTHEIPRTCVRALCTQRAYASCSELPVEDSSVLCQFIDRRFLEHDCFALFSLLMEHTGAWFGKTDSVLKRCRNIQDVLLKRFDPNLHARLMKLDIEPQLYLLYVHACVRVCVHVR